MKRLLIYSLLFYLPVMALAQDEEINIAGLGLP
jgi:hypothetical protein